MGRSAKLGAMLLGMGALSGCLLDQQYQGPAKRCSGNWPDFTAVMLLDGPNGPKVSGYFGYSTNDANDTMVMGPFKDAQNLGGKLNLEAVFDTGNNTVRWKVALKHGLLGGDYEGTIEMTGQGNNTITCDVTLSAVR